MLRSLRLLAVGLLVATVAAACSFPPAEPGGPSLASLDDWVSGRNKIWDVAFPQGWLPPVYTENDSGVIFARWSNAEKGRPMGAVTQFDGAFDPSGEGGLMGIALSPGFDAGTDRRVFVCYSTTTDNRVARFDLDLLGPAYTAISNWTPIVTGLPHNSFHDGCRVRFQPGTGALFVSAGDAGSATAPQSTTVLGGKILRVDMNGAPWPGNASGSQWYTPATGTHRGSRSAPARTTPTRLSTAPTSTTRSTSSSTAPTRLEPERRRRELRPVEADDRHHARARQHHDAGVAVRWRDRRAVGCDVPLGPAVEDMERRARRRVPRRQSVGRPAPARHAPERCRHRAHRRCGHCARSRRTPPFHGPGPGRQPLRGHRRQQRAPAPSGRSSPRHPASSNMRRETGHIPVRRRRFVVVGE